MLNYQELDKNVRTALVKLVQEKVLKDKLNKEVNSRAIKKAFKKENVSRIEIKELRAYLEAHLEDPADEIIQAFDSALSAAILEKFNDLINFSDDMKKAKKSGGEYELLRAAEKYRDAFAQSGLPLTLEQFAVLYSEDGKDAAVKKKDPDTAALQDEIKKLKEKVKEQEDLAKDLKKQKNEAEKKLKDSEKENKKLRQAMTPSSLIKKLKDILPAGTKVKTAEDLQEVLEKMEKESLEAKQYAKVQEVLAAKYALMEVLKEAE